MDALATEAICKQTELLPSNTLLMWFTQLGTVYSVGGERETVMLPAVLISSRVCFQQCWAKQVQCLSMTLTVVGVEPQAAVNLWAASSK